MRNKIPEIIMYVCFIIFMWATIYHMVETNERLNKLELNQNKDDE
jgi:N6-adenosine-specific RNA methylase IME4